MAGRVSGDENGDREERRSTGRMVTGGLSGSKEEAGENEGLEVRETVDRDEEDEPGARPGEEVRKRFGER